MDQTVAASIGAEQLSDSQGAFLRLVAIFVFLGCAASAVPFYLIGGAIDVQRANIALLERENANLDAQIKEKQLQLEEMKAAATIEQQKAQRDIDAMKTVAQMRHDKDESSRTHTMNALTTAANMQHDHALADKQNQFSQQTKTEPSKKPKGE